MSEREAVYAPDFAERARRVRLAVLDVDGVMTDGRIVLDGDKGEWKFFNVQDGHAIKMAQRAEDFRIALVSGRSSAVVARRAKELGIEEVVQGAVRKLPAFEELIGRMGVPFEETAYMGDDVVDIPVLRRVILPMAPGSAVPEVCREVSLVTRAAGGHGAIREALFEILNVQGKWEGILERYYV